MPPKRATCPMPETGEGSGQGSSDKTVERLNKALEGHGCDGAAKGDHATIEGFHSRCDGQEQTAWRW